MTERAPNFCVLTASGINCDQETATGIRLAGGLAELVHLSQLVEGDRNLGDYQGLVLPGGFSEGDAVRAGIVLATQLQAGVGDHIREFVDSERPVLGICNGFQVLVSMGLLPSGEMYRPQTASLAPNASGRFACRWVDLRVNTAASTPLLSPYVAERITLPVANGEGRFRTDPATLARLQARDEILMQYCGPDGAPSMDLTHNPSGADDAIAAVAVGAVLGMMPHPERFVQDEQHANWRRPDYSLQPYGLHLLRGIVGYAAAV
ncbi:MAG TPA: phosphoribosylformylglycinamidine synthase subunit PurQ [Bacillota bacterium]|nr:phosphoribosylformylglycinamidine synthase subunit PurQ [Bacillota bacterium]